MLYIWVTSSVFQSGFIYFFLFHPQNSTKNYQGRCGLTILHQGTLVDFGQENGESTDLSRALLKLPQFIWLMTKPGKEGNFADFSS